MSSAVLEIAGLSKDYRGLRPLRLQQLTIESGETVAITGLDAVTAELFVNLVTGSTLPDTGTVRVFDRATADIADSAEWLTTLDRFGIVTERAVLLDQLTVVQNLAMPFTLEIEPPADDVRLRAEGLAIEVGLPEASLTGTVASLNAAGRARLRLGRALALDPTLVLLEHASAGLTASESSALAKDIRRVAAARRITVVAATADRDFARAVASRVLQLEPATGRLVDRRGLGWFRRR